MQQTFSGLTSSGAQQPTQGTSQSNQSNQSTQGTQQLNQLDQSMTQFKNQSKQLQQQSIQQLQQSTQQGMSDGGQEPITGRDIVLGAVVDQDIFDKCRQLIREGDGLV